MSLKKMLRLELRTIAIMVTMLLGSCALAEPWYEALLQRRAQITEYTDRSAHLFLNLRHNLAWSRQINRFAADLASCRLPDADGRLIVKTSFSDWMRAGENTHIEQGLIEWMLQDIENEHAEFAVVTQPLRDELEGFIQRRVHAKEPSWLKLYDRARQWHDRLAVFKGRGTLVKSTRFLNKELSDGFACDRAKLQADLERIDWLWRQRAKSLVLDLPESAAAFAELADDYQKVRDRVRFGLFGLSAYVEAHEGVDLKDEFHRQWVTICSQISSDLTEAEVYSGKVADHLAVEGNRGIFKPEWIRRAALCPESLIDDSMKTPLDVLLPRILALADELRQNPRTDTAKLNLLQRQVERVRPVIERIPEELWDARQALFFALCRIQREIALLNPLLNFDRLLFIKHPQPHYTQGGFAQPQYFGGNAIGGGGLLVLEKCFSAKPVLKDLLANAVCENGRLRGRMLDQGDFVSPELTWDGKTVYFAYTQHANGLMRPSAAFVCNTRTPENTYHIFRIGVDGKGLRQITDGPFNDFDPVELPNGRVAFISERRGGYGRSGPYRVYTLHTMEPDGGDIVRISHGETNEWHPSVDCDGQIVYTRWNIWDRQYYGPTNMWITKPDGRDARAPTGNYQFGAQALNSRFRGYMPWGMFDIRTIPDSRKFMALVSSYFDYAYGSVILIDPDIPEDGDLARKIKRLTPDQTWPGQGEQNRFTGPCRYATPWPLSERFFLCAYDPEARFEHGPLNRYALYLVDAFGNKILIYRDPKVACQSPMPLRPRPRPPIIAHATAVGRAGSAESDMAESGAPSAPAPKFIVNVAHPISPTVGRLAEVGVADVYNSTHPFPRGARIKALRIVQIAMKSVPGRNSPVVGYGEGTGWDKGGRMVLGTVPVEPDGSAYFTMPAGIPVYFQAIDEQGLAIQVMRDVTYAQPNERLFCLGCHEPRRRSPETRKRNVPLAFQRAPSMITPDVPESNPLTFARLVQPVLDRYCVSCHSDAGGQEPDLTRGDWRNGRRIRSPGSPTLFGTEHWYRSYRNLEDYVHCFKTHLSDPLETIPGTFGARASKLYQIVKDGHEGVQLSEDALHRLALWMDCNCMFYCATTELEKQAGGQIVLPVHE